MPSEGLQSLLVDLLSVPPKTEIPNERFMNDKSNIQGHEFHSSTTSTLFYKNSKIEAQAGCS